VRPKRGKQQKLKSSKKKGGKRRKSSRKKSPLPKKSHEKGGKELEREEKWWRDFKPFRSHEKAPKKRPPVKGTRNNGEATHLRTRGTFNKMGKAVGPGTERRNTGEGH